MRARFTCRHYSGGTPPAGGHHLARTDEAKLYEQLSRGNLVTTWRWYLGVGVAGAILLWGVVIFLYMALVGMGVTGYNKPVFWGLYEASLVFWIGLSHSFESMEWEWLEASEKLENANLKEGTAR